MNRLSGFLTPHYINSTYLGNGFGIPYFFNLAPNYDLTVDPTYLTKQGFFGDAEWRQRLATGAYNIRVTGIFQQDPGAFHRRALWRRRRVNSAARWKARARFISMKNGNTDGISPPCPTNSTTTTTRSKPTDLSNYYFQDVVSSVYLRGQGDRGFFDLSGYRFEGLTQYDFQQQQPLVGRSSTTTR